MLSRPRSRRAAAQKKLEGVGGQLGGLRERGQAAVDTLAPRIETAREALAPRLETAREAAGQALSDASEWAAPRLETARGQAVTTVREKVAPKVGQAILTAAEASKPVRTEAKTRADAALAALRGEVGPPKRKRRWHRMSFLLGAGAITGVAAALVVRRKDTAFTPYEPPRPGGLDPYARPVTPEAPAAPITSLNDEIAGNISPAPPAPADVTPEQAPSAQAPSAQAPNGDAPVVDTTPTETIDVTDEPVAAGGESGGQTGGRHRKRTRRGEPE